MLFKMNNQQQLGEKDHVDEICTKIPLKNEGNIREETKRQFYAAEHITHSS